MNFYSQNSIRLLPKPKMKQKILNYLFTIQQFLNQIKFEFVFKCYECKKLKSGLKKYELHCLNKQESDFVHKKFEYQRVCKECYNDVPF